MERSALWNASKLYATGSGDNARVNTRDNVAARDGVRVQDTRRRKAKAKSNRFSRAYGTDPADTETVIRQVNSHGSGIEV